MSKHPHQACLYVCTRRYTNVEPFKTVSAMFKHCLTAFAGGVF